VTNVLRCGQFSPLKQEKLTTAKLISSNQPCRGDRVPVASKKGLWFEHDDPRESVVQTNRPSGCFGDRRVGFHTPTDRDRDGLT